MAPSSLNVIFASAADASEPTQFEVEHSFTTSSATGRDFTSRGSLFYNDPRKHVADGTKKSPLHVSKASLEGADLEAFKKLVEEDGNYLVRLKSADGASVTAFVRACALVTSNFKEEWAVTMDQFGHITGLNYVPRNQDCTGVDAVKLGSAVTFETNVKLSYPWRGIRPDVKAGQGQGAAPGASGAPPQQQASSAESSNGKDAPQEDNKTFLQKYWMYIAIGVVFMMMNSVPPEDGMAPAGGSRPRAAPRKVQ